jgi:hypothetical protein
LSSRRHLLALAFASALLAAPAARAEAPAAADAVLVALGQWQVKGGRLLLAIPLADALTPKQRAIINGGFTTVSQLTVGEPKPGQEEEDDGDEARRVFSVRCSVKFDAWEESYDVARLDDQAAAHEGPAAPPRMAVLKQFAQYGEMCLKAEVATPKVVAALARGGGTLYASLVVKQTSVEEAARIKDWLIQQQSGVMQSLFSHMLGELTLNQTLKVRISVPPKPETVEGAPARPAKGTKG